MDEANDVMPFIINRNLGQKKTTEIQHFCKSEKVTLNDAVLTCYYRCLFKKLAVPPGDELCIPVMVDMRRYLAEPGNFDALTNLSSTVITRLNYRPLEEFSSALMRVKNIMDSIKSGFIGLNGFIKLNFIYSIFPAFLANRIVIWGLRNPLNCMTNTGILDQTDFCSGTSGRLMPSCVDQLSTNPISRSP